MSKPEFDVIIAGAGPVGLTLALDLAQRGVLVLLVEKNRQPLYFPKMERSNPRTMEIYRRLGLVDTIRAAGLPPDVPMDVMVVSTMADPPLVHQKYPSVNQARAQIAAGDDGRLPREPYQLVSQYALEPILLAAAQSRPGVTVWQSTELLACDQDDAGVTVTVAREDGMKQQTRARYLAGTDGASSTIRKLIGVKMAGRPAIGTIMNIFFRCDDLLEKCPIGVARHYCIAGLGAHGGAAGTLVIQGDMKHFALHAMVPDGTDPREFLLSCIGYDVNPEIIHAVPWTQHLLVAEKHQVGRVFLAGDANHIYIPSGGLGMNTGIVDAINLSWKLAATLAGWGGPELLESYHTERHAAAHRNLGAVTWSLEGVIGWRNAFTPLVLETTPEGRAARQKFVAIADAGNRRVYEMHGADLGYRYVSAVIASNEGPPPASPIQTYEPTTWPGAHLPHVWLAPEDALYDQIETDGFTLLNLSGEGGDTSGFNAAFALKRAPFHVIQINDSTIRDLFARNFILVRPDLHVVWRGDNLPADPQRLVSIVTGWSS